jgi:hypothetical protein
VAVAVLAACSSSPSSPDAPADDPVVAAAAAARAHGADQSQVDVFADGHVTYDEYEQAMTRAFECQRALGATVSVTGTVEKGGVTRIQYTTTTGGADTAALDDCYTRFAQAVDMYWQVSSPDALAFQEQRAAALMPALRECLTEHGVDWSDDESFHDLLAKGVRGQQVTEAPEGGSELPATVTADDGGPAFNCPLEIGYPDWAG